MCSIVLTMAQRYPKLTCKCLGCGQEHTQLVSWFKGLKMRCPSCGGDIDSKPLQELVTKTVNEELKRLRSE